MTLKVLKNTLFVLFFVYGLSLFGLYVTHGYWLSSHRPDQLDSGAFQIAGKILHNGEAKKIYDFNYQKSFAEKLFLKYIPSQITSKKPFYISKEQFYEEYTFPHLAQLYYYYPPNSLPFLYLLTFFGPLTTHLLITFTTFTLLIAALFCSGIIQNWKNTKWYLASLLCFVPLLCNLVWGQITLISFLCFYFYYFFQKQNKNVLASFFLSLCFIKPHLGLSMLFVVLLQKKYKDVGLSLVWTLFFTCISLFWIGFQGIYDYFNLILHLTGFHHSTAFIPKPINSISPFIHYLSLFNGFQSCNLNIVKFSIIPFVSLIIFFAFYINSKEKNTDIKVAKLLLLTNLLNIYTHRHYYSIMLVVSIMAYERIKKLPWLFPVLYSFLPSILEIMFGDKQLVFDFNFHPFWLLNILFIFTI